MQPTLTLLESALIQRILAEAFDLLSSPGVKVQEAEARSLFASAGAAVEGEIVRIPAALAQQALSSVPHQFSLFNRAGEPAVLYGGNEVQFDPGSCAVHILDPETGQHRPSTSADLIRLVQVTEMLPQFAAQSTAMVCSDVNTAIGDMYRLYVVLLYSSKPIVTGAFSANTLPAMIDMLAAECGSPDALRSQPRAIFDVCPSPRSPGLSLLPAT